MLLRRIAFVLPSAFILVACGGSSADVGTKGNTAMPADPSGAGNGTAPAGDPVLVDGGAAQAPDASTGSDPGVPGPGPNAGDDAVVLATGQGDPEDIALDATTIYWVNKTDGTVMSMPKAGGTAKVLATGQSTPRGILLDDAYVYWSNYSNVGSVGRVAKGGGSIITVAANQYYPYRMALRGSTLYFTNDSTSGNVSSVAKTGGAVSVFAASQSSPRGIVADDAAVHWVSWQETKKEGIAGGPIVKLSYKEQFPSALTADATTLYWYDNYADDIRSVPKAGGTAQTLTALKSTNDHGSYSIAVDDQFVYFNDREEDRIEKVLKSGGPRLVVANASAPAGLAIDATDIYFSNQGDGTIRRMAK
jgi:hypothetical protein